MAQMNILFFGSSEYSIIQIFGEYLNTQIPLWVFKYSFQRRYSYTHHSLSMHGTKKSRSYIIDHHFVSALPIMQTVKQDY